MSDSKSVKVPSVWKPTIECGACFGPDCETLGKTVINIDHNGYTSREILTLITAIPALVEMLEGIACGRYDDDKAAADRALLAIRKEA